MPSLLYFYAECIRFHFARFWDLHRILDGTFSQKWIALHAEIFLHGALQKELLEDLDYYNNRRIKLKLKGLTPALHRLQALLVA
ncbi:MAG: hypothetical protein J6K72_06845 [Clostridia bacterium]|nr:hypothetical protein [Clostridia bacterium]